MSDMDNTLISSTFNTLLLTRAISVFIKYVIVICILCMFRVIVNANGTKIIKTDIRLLWGVLGTKPINRICVCEVLYNLDD